MVGWDMGTMWDMGTTWDMGIFSFFRVEDSLETSYLPTDKEGAPLATAMDHIHQLKSSALARFDQVVVRVRERMDAMSCDIDIKMNELLLKREQLALKEQHMERVILTKRNKVKFDVGGKIFSIHKTDLLKYKDSFFYFLLASEIWSPEECSTDNSDLKGAFFLDKSPKYFAYVMDYLRGEELEIQRLSDVEVASLTDLFRSFNLHPPSLSTHAVEKLKTSRSRSEDSTDSGATLPSPPIPLSSFHTNHIVGEGEELSHYSSNDFVTVMHSQLQEASATMMKASSALDQELAAVDAKLQLTVFHERLIEENISMSRERIKLDVGGTIFITTRSTLLKNKNSYFYAMLASGSWLPDEEGTYFINKNPKGFDIVLEFIRNGTISFAGIESHRLPRVLELFEYFQIRIPSPSLTWDTSKMGPDLEVINSGSSVIRKASSAGESSNYAETTAILGAQSTTRFSLRLIENVATKALIGLAPRETFDVYGKNSLNCGWYLSLSTGTLISRSCYNKPYCSAFSTGELITVIFDTQRNEISFERNGKALGVAFTDVPRQALFPAVDVLCCSPLSAFELLLS